MFGTRLIDMRVSDWENGSWPGLVEENVSRALSFLSYMFGLFVEPEGVELSEYERLLLTAEFLGELGDGLAELPQLLASVE